MLAEPNFQNSASWNSGTMKVILNVAGGYVTQKEAEW